MNYSNPQTMPGPGDYTEFPVTNHPNDPRNIEVDHSQYFADQAREMIASDDEFDISCFCDTLQGLAFDAKSAYELMKLLRKDDAIAVVNYLYGYTAEQLEANA